MASTGSKRQGNTLEAVSIVSKQELSSLPPEVIKTLFYLYTGKPDSVIKVFTKKVIVEYEDIIELNRQIREKLDQYSIHGCTTTVTISYDQGITKEFGSWDVFEQHRWTGPEITESLVIKWDFLIQFPQYQAPQRHTVTIRIASGMKPGDMINALISGGLDEVDHVEANSSPMFIRVDFINSLLSSEIINIVERWNLSLKEPFGLSGIFQRLRKHRSRISDLVHYTVPIASMLLMISAFSYSTRSLDTESFQFSSLKLALYWTISIIILTGTIKNLSLKLAKRIYGILGQYGDFYIFNMTNGDRNKQAKIKEGNDKQVKKFILNAGFALLLNIVAGVITAKLF